MKTRPDRSWSHLFPMVVRGETFMRFREIDSRFGLTPGRSYVRYVRDGLRGDELAKSQKSNDKVLDKSVTIGRKSKTVREWLKEKGIKTKTFYSRFYDKGWQVEKACTVLTGVTTGRNHTTGRIVSWRGKTYRLCDFAKKCGLTQMCVKHRLDDGWTPQQCYDRPSDCTKHYRRRCDLGVVKSEIHKAAKAANLPYSRVMSRLSKGWTMEDALTRQLHDRTVAMARRRKDEMAKLGIIL